jgi:hypothetical protein
MASRNKTSRQNRVEKRDVARRAKAITASAASRTVNEYCLLHYGTNFSSGNPVRCSLSSPQADLWVVPVMLASPGYGWVGQVGTVALDAGSGQVGGADPRPKVYAAARRLEEEKHDALEAAFLRTKSQR